MSDVIYEINGKINELVWGPYMIFLILGSLTH